MNSIRAQIKSMLSVEPRSDGFRAALHLRGDLSILKDHFADAPILPGICLIQAVLLAGAMAQNLPELRLTVLKNAKLVGPIFPGETVTIDADTSVGSDGQTTIRAKVSGGDKRRAEISLIAHSTPSADPAPPKASVA